MENSVIDNIGGDINTVKTEEFEQIQDVRFLQESQHFLSLFPKEVFSVIKDKMKSV